MKFCHIPGYKFYRHKDTVSVEDSPFMADEKKMTYAQLKEQFPEEHFDKKEWKGCWDSTDSEDKALKTTNVLDSYSILTYKNKTALVRGVLIGNGDKRK